MQKTGMDTSIIGTEKKKKLILSEDKPSQPVISTRIFHWFTIYFQCQFNNLDMILKALLSRIHPRIILHSLHNETAVSL